MPKSSKHNPAKRQSQSEQPRRKRGRPEKPVKIDDSPRNVAHALFGIRTDKFNRV